MEAPPLRPMKSACCTGTPGERHRQGSYWLATKAAMVDRKMIAQCWLHIGIEKTGTTSIQEFLACNRKALLKAGFLYPAAPGRTNHVGLTCYALHDQKSDSLRRNLGITTQDQLERYRSRLVAELNREIEASRAKFLIFSNEHLSSRLQTAAEIERIKRFCDRIATRTTIIVYIRNQVDFLVSRYIEAVKGGSTNPFSFRATSAVSRYIDYAIMLERWRETFGRGNVVVKRFERGSFEGGDLLLDFASVCGFDGRSLEPVPRRNVALDLRCVEFLREFNRHIPHTVDGRRNPLRGDVVRQLENASTGEPFLVSVETAAAIEEHFRESNDSVRASYFSSSDVPLFFSSLKTAGSANVRVEAHENVRIAAHLWQTQQTTLNAAARRHTPRTGISGSSVNSAQRNCRELAFALWLGLVTWLSSKIRRRSVGHVSRL